MLRNVANLADFKSTTLKSSCIQLIHSLTSIIILQAIGLFNNPLSVNLKENLNEMLGTANGTYAIKFVRRR